jgi:hypothetical protein
VAGDDVQAGGSYKPFFQEIAAGSPVWLIILHYG